MDRMLQEPKRSKQRPPQQLTAAGLISLNDSFSQNSKNDAYAEGAVAEEAIHLYYEEMFFQQRPALRDANLNVAKDATAMMRATNLPVLNGTHLSVHKHPQASDASPLERFAVVSPSNEPFAWLAKAHMSENGIEYGDMLGIDKRTQHMEWIEGTKGGVDGVPRSLQAMNLRKEVRRPRACEPKKTRKRYPF